MDNTNSERKKGEIRKVLPLLWQSYQHVYNVRETSTQNRINFLLIVTTFLPVLSASLYARFSNDLLLLPILLQTIALLILLKDFFIRGRSIPWFETEQLFKDLENGNFEAASFATLKAAEADTHINLVESRKIINAALALLFLSLFAMIEAVLYMLFSPDTMFLALTAINIFGFAVLYAAYYRRSPKFNFSRDYGKYKEEIDEWLGTSQRPRPVEKKK